MSKKGRTIVHHSRGNSDSLHNPIKKIAVHHKRGSSGSGSFGLFLGRTFEDSATQERGKKTKKHKGSRGSGESGESLTNKTTDFMTSGVATRNSKWDRLPDRITEENCNNQGPSIVTTTTTTITTTKPTHCYDNISQKRKWVVQDFNTSIESVANNN
jgi:hypothetical protein